jgi:hypothetical protein
MIVKDFSREEFGDCLSQFCELYRKCFNGYIDEEIVKQRFIENPYNEFFMFAAMEKNKLIAVRCACPLRIIVGGKVKKAAIPLNAMTDPKYAGNNLYEKLSHLLYDKMKKEEIAVKFSFSNNISHRILINRLNYGDIYEIPTLELEVSPQDYIKETGFVNCSFDDLEAKKFHARVMIAKEQQYIDWRYKNAVDRRYLSAHNENGEWVIYKFYEDQINIIDVNVFSREGTADMLDYLVNVSIENGIKRITTWCNIFSPNHTVYEKRGFVNRAPIRYFGAIQFDDEIDVDIFNYKNWEISMGYDNVY